MQRIHLPLVLPGAKRTAILKEVVNTLNTNRVRRAHLIEPDGLLVGQVQLTGQQKLLKYIEMVKVPTDFQFLMTPGYADMYVEAVKTGQQATIPMPQSPALVNALSIPDVFDHMATEFRRLYEEYK